MGELGEWPRRRKRFANAKKEERNSYGNDDDTNMPFMWSIPRRKMGRELKRRLNIECGRFKFQMRSIYTPGIDTQSKYTMRIHDKCCDNNNNNLNGKEYPPGRPGIRLNAWNKSFVIRSEGKTIATATAVTSIGGAPHHCCRPNSFPSISTINSHSKLERCVFFHSKIWSCTHVAIISCCGDSCLSLSDAMRKCARAIFFFPLHCSLEWEMCVRALNMTDMNK